MATLCPSLLNSQQAPDPERAAVQRVIEDFASHVQASNLSALDSLFPPRGLHILTDDATTHGWAEYRDQYLRPEMGRFPGLRYAHTAIEPVVRGDVAWVAFRRELASSAETVEPVQGRGTAVLEKREGRWVIVHLHLSS
jgi:ketosteroid isomerase-like protein